VLNIAQRALSISTKHTPQSPKDPFNPVSFRKPPPMSNPLSFLYHPRSKSKPPQPSSDFGGSHLIRKNGVVKACEGSIFLSLREQKAERERNDRLKNAHKYQFYCYKIGG
jgi:hypothetical protein